MGWSYWEHNTWPLTTTQGGDLSILYHTQRCQETWIGFSLIVQAVRFIKQFKKHQNSFLSEGLLHLLTNGMRFKWLSRFDLFYSIVRFHWIPRMKIKINLQFNSSHSSYRETSVMEMFPDSGQRLIQKSIDSIQHRVSHLTLLKKPPLIL